MRLQLNQQPAIMSEYSTWSYFTDRCSVSAPRELRISGEGYKVHMYLMANSDPKVFLGVETDGSDHFDLSGPDLARTLTPSVFSAWSTHMTRLSIMDRSWTPDQSKAPTISGLVLNFDVVNRITGKVTSHSYNLSIVKCTCVTYDGP
jgi:hypothetical protein